MAPRQAGSYVLIMRLPDPVGIDVGHLGRCEFDRGWYAYAGSARGPGGLAARIDRHRRTTKPLHWHVDYLRAYATAVAVWYTVGERRRECRWARALSELPGARLPAPRFGASDCRCRAHLIGYPHPPKLSTFSHLVEAGVLQEAFGE